MAPIGDAVFATLIMNDAYLPGAMVLGHSLRDRGAKAKLAALVTVDNVSSATIEELRTVFDDIVPVQRIVNKQPANLYVMNRPDLISTFTKIELWRQTQYTRIVYLDADMVVLRAPNELLRLDTEFAAVPDIGWPDCFNSGMMVLNPNMGDYFSLLALAQRGISFDGADQGLLNMHFREWERLSFAYNCTPSGNYQYVPAYRHFQSSINAVHFIGRDKPWTLGRENRFNHGVYGELLGMWWAVYDRHYRQQTTIYVSEQSMRAPKRVQDYVRGEETLYLPDYARVPQQQPQILAPSVVIHPPAGQPPEQPHAEPPFGDAPSPAQQVVQEDFKPTSTVEQRRFSAPHVEWEPTRAPPPTNSKPEASNFPTTIYDMSQDTKLFQAPAKYPEAPKDMWYKVPAQPVQQPKPKPIFPWEGRAPKATRVFAEPAAPGMPLEPSPAPVEPESIAPAATLEETGPVEQPEPPEPVQSPDPWAGFQSRSNAWDEVPEIDRYMQAFQKPKRQPIQVLRQAAAPGVTSPPGRKPSLKLTDFPTVDDRPSLPVTPMPIRRPMLWGEERDQDGNLPTAEGVPQQEEWVRRFSSYPVPEFPALSPLLQTIDGILIARCQFCGKQNPIAKLEELQRRQSGVLMSPTQLQESPELPTRKMPESASLEAVEEADNKAISPVKSPKVPLKPILKNPTFELPAKEEASEKRTSTGVDTAADPSEPKIPSAEYTEDTSAPDKPATATLTTVQG